MEMAKKQIKVKATEGKPITSSKQDVFDIKLMHEDCILPSDISDKFGIDAIMVCRIINSFISYN